MKTNGARSLDHATLEAMRERAVRGVQNGENPEVVARVIGVNRSTMYGWLAQYRRGGWRALKTKPLFGRPRINRFISKKTYWRDETNMTHCNRGDERLPKARPFSYGRAKSPQRSDSCDNAPQHSTRLESRLSCPRCDRHSDPNGDEAQGDVEFVLDQLCHHLSRSVPRTRFVLIVDSGPAHVAKRTKTFVASVSDRFRFFYLSPYSPHKNSEKLVWKHLKADAVGRDL
jgi:hypothetical protein